MNCEHLQNAHLLAIVRSIERLQPERPVQSRMGGDPQNSGIECEAAASFSSLLFLFCLKSNDNRHIQWSTVPYSKHTMYTDMQYCIVLLQVMSGFQLPRSPEQDEDRQVSLTFIKLLQCSGASPLHPFFASNTSRCDRTSWCQCVACAPTCARSARPPRRRPEASTPSGTRNSASASPCRSSRSCASKCVTRRRTGRRRPPTRCSRPTRRGCFVCAPASALCRSCPPAALRTSSRVYS